jgi:hypothetical protein
MSVHAWYSRRRLATQDELEDLERSYEVVNVDRNSSRRILDFTIYGPYPYGHISRFSYSRDDIDNVCSVGLGLSLIGHGFIENLVKVPNEYDEYQIVTRNTNTREEVVAGIVYAKSVPIAEMIRNRAYDALNLADHQIEGVMNIVSQYKHALYIELLCSPLYGAGTGEAFFSYMKRYMADTFDIIILKAVDDEGIREFYQKMGFQTFESFDLTDDIVMEDHTIDDDDDGLLYLYLPIRPRRR